MEEERLRRQHPTAKKKKKNGAHSTFVHFAVYVHEEIGNGDAQTKPHMYFLRELSYRRLCIESFKRKRSL